MYTTVETGPRARRAQKRGLPAMPGAPLPRYAYFVTLGGVNGVAATDWGEVVLA